MNLQVNRLLSLRVLLLSVILVCLSVNIYSAAGYRTKDTTHPTIHRKVCIARDNTVRAKRKKCLLRPDSGPCRADILMYYYDARQQRCYRFYYGGCQGNGNNFKTRRECRDQCLLSPTNIDTFHRPYFCSLAFDFGTCFGHYNRYTWDPVAEICRQRIYSGCGGNQNNFETKQECMDNCLNKANNTLNAPHQQFTTCIPFAMPDFD